MADLRRKKNLLKRSFRLYRYIEYIYTNRCKIDKNEEWLTSDQRKLSCKTCTDYPHRAYFLLLCVDKEKIFAEINTLTLIYLVVNCNFAINLYSSRTHLRKVLQMEVRYRTYIPVHYPILLYICCVPLKSTTYCTGPQLWLNYPNTVAVKNLKLKNQKDRVVGCS